jgi:hypothetical protein
LAEPALTFTRRWTWEGPQLSPSRFLLSRIPCVGARKDTRVSEAADAFARAIASAIEAYGIEGGRRVGMTSNLEWLIERGVETQRARAIRDRYWPRQ